jgi:energy-coupling factor transporter transmembrane protein EcfT
VVDANLGMASFSSPTLGMTLGLVLFFAGVLHALHPRMLHGALDQHGVWPVASQWIVTGAVVVVETVLGAATVVVVATGVGGAGVQTAVLASATILFLIYGAYTILLLRTHPGVACGCETANVVLTAWVPIRALLLAGVGVAVAAATPHSITGSSGTHAIIVAEASLALAIILLVLPSAVSDVQRLSEAGEGRGAA